MSDSRFQRGVTWAVVGLAVPVVWYLDPLSGWAMWKVIFAYIGFAFLAPMVWLGVSGALGQTGGGLLSMMTALVLMAPLFLAMLFFWARGIARWLLDLLT